MGSGVPHETEESLKSCLRTIDTGIKSYEVNSIISPSARQVKLSYDSSGRVTAVINPAGVTMEGYPVEIPLLWIQKGLGQ